MLNAVPLAARDADEAAKVMESRFVIAQLLTSTGETESAIAELRAVRPLLAAAYGARSRRRSATSQDAAATRAAADGSRAGESGKPHRPPGYMRMSRITGTRRHSPLILGPFLVYGRPIAQPGEPYGDGALSHQA